MAAAQTPRARVRCTFTSQNELFDEPRTLRRRALSNATSARGRHTVSGSRETCAWLRYDYDVGISGCERRLVLLSQYQMSLRFALHLCKSAGLDLPNALARNRQFPP